MYQGLNHECIVAYFNTLLELKKKEIEGYQVSLLNILKMIKAYEEISLNKSLDKGYKKKSMNKSRVESVILEDL